MSDSGAATLPPGLDPRRGSGEGRRPRWQRVLRVAAVVVAVVVLLAAGGGYLLYRHYNGQITRVDIRLAQPEHATSVNAGRVAATADGSQNILLMGSDSRDFAGGQAYNVAPGSPAYVTGERSDVVMLLHIPAGGGKPTVVSFPRDSWMTIPAYTDSKGVAHVAVPAKLNAAFAFGGAPLLVSTIEDFTGLHIDHFVSVNFPGFQGMVDALGGLNVCIGTSRHDAYSGDYLTAGDHHVDGAQALALVRDRESFADQDLGRIKDQQYFLSVMLHKVLSAGTLTNPLKLNDFLDVATKSLTVDSGLSLGDMRKLASRFAHFNAADMLFVTAPVKNGDYHVTSSVYGKQVQSAVLLDPVGNARLFASFKAAAGPSSTPTPSSATTTLSPGDVEVAVENGTAKSGLAHETATKLIARGFVVKATGNAAGANPTTVIRYGPGQLDAAQTLQAAIPQAQLRADDTLTTALVLMLGDDFPTLATSASATPAVTAKPISGGDLNCAP